MMNNQPYYYTAADLMQYLGISKNVAYEMIRRWNRELAQQDYVTVSGKVPRAYADQHIYSPSMNGKE